MSREKKDYYSIDIVFGGLTTEETENSANIFSPAMDIYESDAGVFIEVELPGMEGDDVKVVWENEKLLLKGKKRFDKNSENLKFYLLERPYGSFNKVIEIPIQAESEVVSAKLKDGVLKIFIPYKSKKNFNENNS